MKATVIGARGFIGAHLVRYLEQGGANVFAPGKNDLTIFARSLGHVFYCAGLTADFRQKPVETIKAHVVYLLDVLERAKYDSLLYLSSTRVYAGSISAQEEEKLRVNPCDPSDLYNLSKLTGEATCLAFASNRVRIAKLSNVYGAGMDAANFLPSLIQDAVMRGRILLQTSLESVKDYVWIRDVVEVLPKIALSGDRRLYNVAEGRNVSTNQIVERLKRLTGCTIDVAPNAPTVAFPQILTDRVRAEFGFSPVPVEKVIEEMVADCHGKSETV